MRLAFQQKPRTPERRLCAFREFARSSSLRPPSNTPGRIARTYVIVQMNSSSTVISDEKLKIADILGRHSRRGGALPVPPFFTRAQRR